MTCYYNDSDPFVCAWLKNLIAAGLIPPGEVDERPIQEVTPDDVRGYSQAHFFAGIGGWAYALQLAGWPVDRPVWTGSCPCQPFSIAGASNSHRDRRHLWPTWFRLIRECCPLTVLGEQVSAHLGVAWVDAVLRDLEGEGYAVGSLVLGAHSVGAPHIRQRFWFVADTMRTGLPNGRQAQDERRAQLERSRREWWTVEPDVGRMAHGVPGRVGRLRAYGNAIVPQVAAAFVSAYMDTLSVSGAAATPHEEPRT